MSEIEGYLRQDGRKGIRNAVVIAYMVECARHVAQEIVLKFRGQAQGGQVHMIGFPGCYPNDYASRRCCQVDGGGYRTARSRRRVHAAPATPARSRQVRKAWSRAARYCLAVRR